MVYPYGRKRRPATRKTQRKRKSRLSFKTRVLKALQGENKIAKLYQVVDISNEMNEPIQLMPNIAQGTSQHAERVGNEISLKRLTVKGFFTVRTQTTASGTEFLTRQMILRQRNVNAASIIVTPTLFDSNNLLNYDQPYEGTPNNWLQKHNSSRFVCRKDIKRHLSVTANAQGDANANPQPDSIKFFSHTITFGKQGKTLHYTDDAALISGNFPYIMAAAIHSPSGATPLGLPTMQLYTEAIYTDL